MLDKTTSGRAAVVLRPNNDDSGAGLLLKIGMPRLDVQPVCLALNGLKPIIFESGAGSLLKSDIPNDADRLQSGLVSLT